MQGPNADERYDDCDDAGAVAKGTREESAQRRADEQPVKAVTYDAANPTADGGQHARSIAEPGLGVNEDDGIDIRPLCRLKLENAGQRLHAGASDRSGDEGAEGVGRCRESARWDEDAGAGHHVDDHRSQG